MAVYYNEIDPFAAAWLRELIKAGLIAPGEVDERSIEDVIPSELMGYSQCHFFAGIGVWSHALRQAGWPDDRPVWTGSCPCQPFCAAGKGGGTSDERHLWPAFFWIIRQCRPDVVFGEQVEAALRHDWLDHVAVDLEAEGYTVGAVSTPACGYGSPHKRSRLYWVANTEHDGRDRQNGTETEPDSDKQGKRIPYGDYNAGILGDSESQNRGILLQRRRSQQAGIELGRPDPTNGFWRNAEWIPCRDGKARPVEPGTFPLAHGAPARVGRLRGYGNAIVAPQAAAFVRAYMDNLK